MIRSSRPLFGAASFFLAFGSLLPPVFGMGPTRGRRGWDLLGNSAKAHGTLACWNKLRDFRLRMKRQTLREDGSLLVETEEEQLHIKGDRPRVRLERGTEKGRLIYGFDGRRSWVTLNGYRYRSEESWVRAERRTRWQSFLLHQPFLLRDGDARSEYLGPTYRRGKSVLRIDVRYRGQTRPSEETYRAHLDAQNFRLLSLEADRPEWTPGTHMRVDFSDFQWVHGVLIPFRREIRRSDRLETYVETILGIEVNTDPSPQLFRNPMGLPDYAKIYDPDRPVGTWMTRDLGAEDPAKQRIPLESMPVSFSRPKPGTGGRSSRWWGSQGTRESIPPSQKPVRDGVSSTRDGIILSVPPRWDDRGRLIPLPDAKRPPHLAGASTSSTPGVN